MKIFLALFINNFIIEANLKKMFDNKRKKKKETSNLTFFARIKINFKKFYEKFSKKFKRKKLKKLNFTEKNEFHYKKSNFKPNSPSERKIQKFSIEIVSKNFEKNSIVAANKKSLFENSPRNSANLRVLRSFSQLADKNFIEFITPIIKNDNLRELFGI